MLVASCCRQSICARRWAPFMPAATSAHGAGIGAVADDGAASRLLVRWTDVDLDAVAGSLGYELPTPLGSRGSGAADLKLPGRLAAAGALPAFDALDADVSELAAIRRRRPCPSRRGRRDRETRRLVARDTAWRRRPRPRALEGTLRGRLDARTDDATNERLDERAARRSAARRSATRRSAGARGCESTTSVRPTPSPEDAGVALPAALADLRGRLDADVRASGTVSRPAAQATLAARDVRAGGIVPGAKDVPGAVDATLTATRDALRVQSLAMTLGPTRLHAAGSCTPGAGRPTSRSRSGLTTSPRWRACSSRRRVEPRATIDGSRDERERGSARILRERASQGRACRCRRRWMRSSTRGPDRSMVSTSAPPTRRSPWPQPASRRGVGARAGGRRAG